MSLPVSTQFENAAAADSNLPAAQVQLVLGNYMNADAFGATAASSGDFSADYPAAGAIDGDRTEINVGPAAGADNDVGRSSWRSSGIPDNGDTVTLTITFPSAKTLNRIKLYHLSGHGLRTYQLSYWTGSSFAVFAATSDIAGPGEVSIATTGELDVVEFDDISTTQVRLTVLHTDVASDRANVVEIEAYRRVDISDRVKGISKRAQRDYKLGNPLATTVTLEGINTDRFFSVSHVPTAEEAAAGFVNSELLPGIGVEVSLGFDVFAGEPELASAFVGTVDRITLKPRTRDVTIEARDGMKGLINRQDSTKLKTGQDIAANIRYVLNRANVSDYEMVLDTTPINIDYFFTEAQDHLSTIRDLVQAAGDALFYFDETGIARFRYFTADIPLSHLYTSQVDWEAGARTNIATKDGTGTLKVPTKFVPVLADGSLSGNAIISGGNLTVSNGWQGETVPTNGVGTGSGGTASSPNRVTGFSVRIVPVSTGTITSIDLTKVHFSNSADTGGSTTYVRLALCAESGGLPGTQIASVRVHLTPLGGAFIWPGPFPGSPVSVSFPVTGGTAYWISVEEDPLTPQNCTFNVTGGERTAGSWSGGVNVKARFTPNNPTPCVGNPAAQTPWENWLGSSATPIGQIAGSYVVTGAPTSGGWTSTTYDSFSDAVGAAAQLIESGSYPGGSTGTLFLEGSNDGTTFVASYFVVNPNGTTARTIVSHRYWRLRVAMTGYTGVGLPSMGPPTFYFAASGTWISPVLDTGANTIAYGLLTSTTVLNTGAVTFYTRSSPDGVTWDPWVAVSGTGQILSAVQRYLEIRADLFLSATLLASPSILDITVNWTGGAGSPKYPPAPAAFTFSFDSSLLDVQQEISDNLGGDSAILNDVTVQAQPLVLTGADADTVWQGTIGTPPSNIDPVTPRAVTAGDVITISPVISGGMDIARMSGANPPAAAITFADGAAGTWAFTSIHPTRPVLVITISAGGNITDLRIVGKVFSNASYIQAQTVVDDASIARHGDRQTSISNAWIVGASTALAIAQTMVDNYKDPVHYIPAVQVRPQFSAQLGDRATVVDDNLDLSGDYIIVGLDHEFTVSVQDATVETAGRLLKVPAGL